MSMTTKSLKMTQMLNSAVLLLFLISQVFNVLVDGLCTGYTSPIVSTATSGYLQSPRYPKSYRDYENCKWSLNYPYDHRHYIAYFDIVDYQMSYKRFDNSGNKCTGYMSIFKAQTDCKSSKPFCNVYYVSDQCEKVANERYSDCNKFKRRTLIPTEVAFKSEPYYSDRTPQRGFKLRYEFVDCLKALKTTPVPTTSTEATTTPKPTTTTATTTSTTTESVTTTSLTSTIEQTAEVKSTSSNIFTTKSPPRPLMTTSLNAPPKVTTSHTPALNHTSGTSHVYTTAKADQNEEIITAKVFAANGVQKQIAPRSTTTTSKQEKDNTTPEPGCSEGSDCANRQSIEAPSSLGWIAAPIIIGILIIGFVLYIVLIRRRQKQKSEDIGYLMGIENPHYNGLMMKDGVETGAGA
ncbi:uncharacterized protein LOC120345372 [Styela clava]